MQIDPEELIPSAETARLLAVKEQTLAAWRHFGRGPRFCKVGRSIFYRRDDLRAWLGEQMRAPAAKSHAA